mmetsp:Transcript_11746/g.20905  ORF Transcript_11746/g.20905 Transcript_11746/m.20905 type:complete len:294 (+) Transcript_11746:491-1372(+)
MSSAVTSVRPSNAANAFAARVVTMSPRMPSTSNSEQIWLIFTRKSYETSVCFNRVLASTILSSKARCVAWHLSRKSAGFSSNWLRWLTICTRNLGSFTVPICACMPKRSNSWGRSSPSSGLPLPTRMKRAGWLMLMPSRSTVFQPDAAESSRTSTKWSSSRLTSSTYKMPRLALASRPGSNAFLPSVSAFSISMVPHTRSSVAPRGRSTMGIFIVPIFKTSPAFMRSRISSLITSGSSGSELKGSLSTTFISGSRSARARMVVDFPVPRSPIIITPPILGSITFRMRASFISS